MVIVLDSPASLVTINVKSFTPACSSFSPLPVTVVGSVTVASMVTFEVPIGTVTLYSVASRSNSGSKS